MCEFCTKHGDGQVWFKNAANYARDLMADLERRKYIADFFSSTIHEGIVTIGRLESLYRKKNRLPERLVKAFVSKAEEDHFGQVVTIEEIREIVGKAASVVRLPCACRWASSRTEDRCCYSVSYTPETWFDAMDMSYFGLPQSEGLESVGTEEAIKQMEALGQNGAVHSIWTMKTPFIGAICNCQPADCLGLRSLSIDLATMMPGEAYAAVDAHKCNGCGACEEACHFGAIDAVSFSGEDKARIQPSECFGCGNCRHVCAEDALSMVPRQP